MKLSTSSHTLVVSCIQQALQGYVSGNGNQVITDIHMQVDIIMMKISTGKNVKYVKKEKMLKHIFQILKAQQKQMIKYV